jgi:hypothetical protein
LFLWLHYALAIEGIFLNKDALSFLERGDVGENED